jgi:Tol biopolymer transport system component
VAVVAVVLTGCHVGAVGPSLLRVGSDRSVAVPVQCRHDTEACTGTAVVRVDGLDSDAVPYTVAPGGTEVVDVTLTEQQYDLVPSDVYVPAEVRLDSTGPAPARLETAVRGLRRAGPTTRRVSIAPDGSDPNQGSTGGVISSDGRYVAFFSEASNLVPEDANTFGDIFRHDAVTGEISLVSVAWDGSGATGGVQSGGPAMSADGRHVAFLAWPGKLVPGVTSGPHQVFVRDVLAGVTTHVSVSTDGAQGNDFSYQPAISADGRYVAFRSLADNLVPGDTNNQPDVFVHDRLTSTTTRVSVSSTGAQAAWVGSTWGSIPALSADGRYVAFESLAGNLVPGDTNGTYDAFVHDRLTGTTTRVSVRNDGSQVSGVSNIPNISADGRYIAFVSTASNLVPGDTNGLQDVFLHDRLTGATTAISTTTDGTTANRQSSGPDIGADGRYVAYTSSASNLVPGDTNDITDVFIYDRLAGTTTRASVAFDGAESNDSLRGGAPDITPDGRHVVFTSKAWNLVPGLTKPWTRVFVRDLD